jgi:hypothetical protein
MVTAEAAGISNGDKILLSILVIGMVLAAEVLPQPTEEQRKAPEIPRGNATTPSEQMAFSKQ